MQEENEAYVCQSLPMKRLRLTSFRNNILEGTLQNTQRLSTKKQTHIYSLVPFFVGVVKPPREKHSTWPIISLWNSKCVKFNFRLYICARTKTMHPSLMNT